MKTPDSIPAAIALWPSRRALAAELGRPEATVHKWAQRGRIPAEEQAGFLRAARNKGFAGISAEWLIEIHARAEGSPDPLDG